MDTAILLDILKAFGRFFLNPIVYWIILLMVMPTYDRVKKEQYYFLHETAEIFAETKRTIKVSVIATIFLAAFTLGAGVAFTYEIIIVLMALTLLLSIMYRYSLLSPSYIFGLTFMFLFFMPNSSTMIKKITPLTMSALAVIIGILLIFEGILFFTMRRNDFFPTLVRSRRGLWLGMQHLKRLAIIPAIVLVPTGSIQSIGEFWPYFVINNETYSLFIFPAVIGFHQIVTGELPAVAAKKLGRLIILLGLFVFVFSLLSISMPGMALIAVVIAIVGRALIQILHYVIDAKRPPVFIEGSNSLKILGVINKSPAEQLGFITGETIVSFNGEPINRIDEFNRVIKKSEGIGTFELIDENNKVRKIDNKSYKGDRHDLGILFAARPFSLKSMPTQ